MTLEEAIKHCEEVANDQEHDAETWEMSSKHWGDDKQSVLDNADECKKCAAEHRQIAEWLKELKQYRELFDSPEEASFVRTTFYEGALN